MLLIRFLAHRSFTEQIEFKLRNTAVEE